MVTAIFTNDISRSLQYIIFIPISNFLAFLYVRYRKALIIPISLLTFFCIGKFLFISIFTLISNYNSERTVDLPYVTLLTRDKTKVDLHQRDDKVIILDFWSTSCSICFKKFPDLQRTFEKYKDNKNVQFFAVNYPLPRDRFNKTVQILDSIGYSFPQLFAQSSHEIEEKLHFNTFPHLLIIKNGKIRYEGLFETKDNTIFYSVESQVDKLLRE
jgi:thiol-disulfide isomerase/thioredoxin